MGESVNSPWKPKYTKILIYAEQGLQINEIAQKVGISRSQINKVMNRPDYQLKKLKVESGAIEATRKLFEEHLLEAGMKVVSTMRKGKAEERLQYDAAKEILYQVGLKPVEVIETRKREYTPEELQSALHVSKEIEEITDRLGKTQSKFLVASSTSAPVPATKLENVIEAKIAGGDQIGTARESNQTSGH